MSIEIAAGQLLRPDKHDDAVLVRPLDDARHLVAVADGLSLSAGRIASELVIRIIAEVTDVINVRTLFEHLRNALDGISAEHPDSETTLTCALISEMEVSGSPYLHCEYFAIGDSPIWRVTRAPIGGRYAFQRYVVHGAPYPGETAKVYATVRSRQGVGVTGSVAFGSVDVPSNEVLVICTDGVPEREVFGREQAALKPLSARPILCEWMFATDAYDNDRANQVLKAYDERGLLYDDATLIVARIRPVAEKSEAATVSEDATIGSSSDVIGDTQVATEARDALDRPADEEEARRGCVGELGSSTESIKDSAAAQIESSASNLETNAERPLADDGKVVKKGKRKGRGRPNK